MQIVQWSTERGFIDIPHGPETAFSKYDYVYILSRYNNQNHIFKSKLDSERNPTKWINDKLDDSIPIVGGNFVPLSSRVYIIGGTIDDTTTNAMYFAPFKADRTLGAWKRSRNLPIFISNSAAVNWNGTIYLFGGKDANGVATNSIVAIELNENDTIKNITTLKTKLPVNLFNATPIIYKNNVFLFGGSSGAFPTASILRIIKDDRTGDLLIKYLNPLPIALEKPAVGQLGDKVFVIGGQTISSAGTVVTSKNTYISFFNTSGNLQFWSNDLQLPYDVDELSLVNNQVAFYIIGGLINNMTDRLIITPRFYGENNETLNEIDTNVRTRLSKQIRFLNISIIGLIFILVFVTIIFNMYL